MGKLESQESFESGLACAMTEDEVEGDCLRILNTNHTDLVYLNMEQVVDLLLYIEQHIDLTEEGD